METDLQFEEVHDVQKEDHTQRDDDDLLRRVHLGPPDVLLRLNEKHKQDRNNPPPVNRITV